MMFKTLIFSSMLLASALLPTADAAEQLYSKQPSVSPELSNPGKWPVGVTTLKVTNKNQLSSVDFTSRVDRPLTLEVWYPAKADESAEFASYQDQTRSGKTFDLLGFAKRDINTASSENEFPLIVLSHGYTGYRSLMFYLGEHLASHGYVVASIDHTDSRNRDVDFTVNPGAGYMSTLLNRARDQQFVLEYLNDSDTLVHSIINPDKAAVVGYSMGGFGAINTVGGCYDHSDKVLRLFGVPEESVAVMQPELNTCAAGRESVDPRWQAMIAFAPWGGRLKIHQAASLKKLQVATLFIAGENDDVSGYENGVKSIFELTGSDNNYLMVYENARHNIAAHPAPKVAYGSDLDIGHYFEPSWHSETINRINQHMSLAFLDCHVKQKESACAMLPSRQEITQERSADGTLSPAWPGFSERWGTGIQFIRK